MFSRLATVFEGDFHPWIEKVSMDRCAALNVCENHIAIAGD